MTGFTTEQLLEIAEKETAKLVDPDDREDAKQEFILGVLEAQEKGDPEKEGYRAYLWSYGRGRVMTFLAQQKKYSYRQNREINVHAATDYSRGRTEPWIDTKEQHKFSSPEELAQKTEEQQQLQAAIQTLSENQQHVINAYFLQDKSLQEIAQDLGISKQAVAQRKDNALSKLQTALA